MFYEVVLPIILSYLLGSVNFSFFIASYIRGIDIREYGSGNAGATNTFRVLGKGPALIVGVFDALKGVGSLGIGFFFSDYDSVVFACGLAAVIGHNWPVFLGFRGGKGIATTIGITLVLFPFVTVISGICGILAVYIFRYVSVGSIVFAFFIPVFLILYKSSLYAILLGVVLFLLALLRHRGNIHRVLSGIERKV